MKFRSALAAIEVSDCWVDCNDVCNYLKLHASMWPGWNEQNKQTFSCFEKQGKFFTGGPAPSLLDTPSSVKYSTCDFEFCFFIVIFSIPFWSARIHFTNKGYIYKNIISKFGKISLIRVFYTPAWQMWKYASVHAFFRSHFSSAFDKQGLILQIKDESMSM